MSETRSGRFAQLRSVYLERMTTSERLESNPADCALILSLLTVAEEAERVAGAVRPDWSGLLGALQRAQLAEVGDGKS